MFIDQYYLMLVFPALLLSLAAQFWVSSAFSRWSKVQTSGRISGQDAAHLLLRNAGITDVAVEPVPGRLTDHYSPTEKKLRLSDAVYGAYSVAAVGVAAHETGHAIQHKNGYGPLWLRSVLVPAANIGSTLGPYIVIAGLIFILRQNRVLNEEELRGVKKVLTAAAMTYVASALTAVLSLLRLILLARNSRNR